MKRDFFAIFVVKCNQIWRTPDKSTSWSSKSDVRPTERLNTSLCSLVAQSGSDTCGPSHERVWLQEAQCQFCPGLHRGPNRSGSGKELIWYHYVRSLSCLSLFCTWMLCNSEETVMKCWFSALVPTVWWISLQTRGECWLKPTLCSRYTAFDYGLTFRSHLTNIFSH